MRWLLIWLLAAIGFFRSLFSSKLVAEIVPDNPVIDRLPRRKLVVVGGPGYHKWAYLRCPCGCGTAIMLQLSKNRRPSWSVSIDHRGHPTVTPSIWQNTGCCSHFFLRAGRIIWVGKGVPPPPHRA